eukprot:TRINITY_DN17155_c0_g1_i1.p1 TRINITY_DN17155_c0_g1~~TRINITY_DN17155_c0_g1_i1.p1  ORF type:complete len:194 (-),score=16.63 TRINITY_DN17155_c0_g1_i1:236-760(-)
MVARPRARQNANAGRHRVAPKPRLCKAKRVLNRQRHFGIAKRTYHRLPSSGLKIRQPWLNKILSRQKTWELRSCATKTRGSIGLCEVGSCTVLGKAEVADCIYIGKYVNGRWIYNDKKVSLRSSFKKHRCKASDVANIGYTTLYAWVLRKVVRFPKPRPFNALSGCVTWTALNA